MRRIRVQNPVVEIDGDEMAHVMWQLVRDQLVSPYVELDLIRFDLSLANRERTRDEVTTTAAHAVTEHGVGVKCATITPDRARVAEAGLSRAWPSPNGTIRDVVGGVIFREPILIGNVPRLVPGWTRPIVIGRHAHGDQYRATNFVVPGAGELTMTFTPDDGSDPVHHVVARYGPDGGVALGMYNFTRSIEDFARASLGYGLARGLPVYLSTKKTVLKAYDGAFEEIFARVFEEEFRVGFEAAGLTYEHRLIDDMVASALKWEGGYLWACKNYDGDVQSDAVAQGFGSPGLMSSVLVAPDGRTVLTEAAHGTVARHFRQHQAGVATSTNPVATIYAWARGLAHRGRLDGNGDLVRFATTLEEATVGTVEHGTMTRDLASIVGNGQRHVGTERFVRGVADRLTRRLAEAR